jgi:UTP-glucose-1-phosphate uridylyltransferase
VPAGRRKPWGTGHAIRAARDVIREPFAAINADDFYGPEAYRLLAQFLMTSPAGPGGGQDYAMVGFDVRKTLSRHGSVSRGVCSVAPDGFLRQVVERTRIEEAAGKIRYWVDDATTAELQGNEVVARS